MDLSIVIVNYRSTHWIMGCLESLYEQKSEIEFEVMIVDNQSGDDGKSIILKVFPQVRWIQMNYNAGFARGNNEGIRQSRGSVILLLNPDTIILGNAVEDCYSRLISSDYIAAGVQLLNDDDTPQISGNYFMTGGLNHLIPVPFLGKVIRWLGLKLKIRKTNIPEAEGTMEVDWINGAFLMVKKNILSRSGLLDEDFFLYSEEIEWCYRLGQHGKLCIYGDLRVKHLTGTSSTEAFNSSNHGYAYLADKKGLQLMVSNHLRIRKQFGVFWLLFHNFVHFLAVPVYFIANLVQTFCNPNESGRNWKEFGGYSKNVLRLMGFLPSMVLNKHRFYKVL